MSWHLDAKDLHQEDHQTGPAAGGEDGNREEELIELEFLQRLLQLKLLMIILEVNQSSLIYGRGISTKVNSSDSDEAYF